MKKYLLLLLCIPLLVTGCKKVPKLDNGQEVVVELNGKQYTANELFDALKEDYGTSVLINLVDKYITQSEMTEDEKKDAEAKAKAEYDSIYATYQKEWDDFLAYYGFLNGDEVLEQLRANYEQNIVLEKYIKSDVIKEEDIKKYYDEDIYGEITARHILIEAEVTSDMTDEEKKEAENKALEEAKELINQLNGVENLEEKFIELAKEKSDDTGSASEGGLIENFTNETGLVEEFWEASLELEVGKMTAEPVKTEFGYHIIYKVKQNEKPAMDTVLDRIKDNLVDEILSEEDATYIYWSGLREKYNMTIHDDILKNNYDATMNNLKK